MRSVLAVIVGVLLGACTKEQAGPPWPGAGGEKVCTQIGCINGLRIELVKASPWAPGSYGFAFDLDGAKVACTGTLPLKACDAGPSITCDVADRVQIGESGCAMDAKTHGFADIQILGGEMPRAVGLAITLDGAPLIDAKLTPAYRTTRPNGEGCEPQCTSASEQVPMP